jgi:hypothetical protein
MTLRGSFHHHHSNAPGVVGLSCALALFLSCACWTSPDRRMTAPASDGGWSVAVDGAAMTMQATRERRGVLDAETTSPVPGSSAADSGPPGSPQAEEPEPLQAEEHDNDPRSQTVTIKILVDPPKHPRVFWGQKDLGAAPLEILRPRGSAPLDLAVRAPGYLTVHTRAFCDRDDKLSIHLVLQTDAPRMLGYRAPTVR